MGFALRFQVFFGFYFALIAAPASRPRGPRPGGWGSKHGPSQGTRRKKSIPKKIAKNKTKKKKKRNKLSVGCETLRGVATAEQKVACERKAKNIQHWDFPAGPPR